MERGFQTCQVAIITLVTAGYSSLPIMSGFTLEEFYYYIILYLSSFVPLNSLEIVLGSRN